MTRSTPPRNIVFYADDDTDDLELVQDAFSQYAHNVEVVTAKDGSQALSYLQGNVTNVVVTNANDLHKEVVKEAIRVVSSSPPWSPSEQCGQPVKTYQTERITFCDCKED